MVRPLRLGSTFVATAAFAVAGLTAVPADAHTTGIHDNCTNFNQRYPHGVGTRGARGWHQIHFLRNNRIYWLAEHHNPDLDRDNDHIACEQA